MLRIIGIDPGSRITGYGIVDWDGRAAHYIASGAIKTETKEIPARLEIITRSLLQIATEYQPAAAAVEQVFMQKNASAALKLGQARGAAVVALMLSNLPVAEYSARQVKQAVVGYGNAIKQQVQQMVCSLLQLSATPQADAADALAVALCHAHSHQSMALIGGAGFRQGRVK